MLRAYRLIITNYDYAPPQRWEWEQPHTRGDFLKR